MLAQDQPSDFVIGTDQTQTVERFAELAFSTLGMNYKDYVVIDPMFYRPAEVDLLVSDSTRARTQLGWEPTVGFEELVELMVMEDYERLKKGLE